MRISDWSSDVCSSDLRTVEREKIALDRTGVIHGRAAPVRRRSVGESTKMGCGIVRIPPIASPQAAKFVLSMTVCSARRVPSCRSEEHTSELQSLMRISYAVFCLKKKTTQTPHQTHTKHDISKLTQK